MKLVLQLVLDKKNLFKSTTFHFIPIANRGHRGSDRMVV